MSTEPHPPELREGEEAPPPGIKVMGIVRWMLLILAAAGAAVTIGSYFASGRATTVETKEPKYYCPMHPQVTSDVPGECPICGMRLERIPADWHKDAGTGATPAGGSSASTDPRPPPNRVPLTLTLDRVQAVGVRVAPVTSREVSLGKRITATVAAPEQGAASVHARASGYVERISVQETGIKVRKGQELLAIYSPEIYQAEAELLATRAWNAGDAGVAPAARQKLELLGMSPAAIDRVLATGTLQRAVSIAAPSSGYVTKKNAVLGSFVTPEMELYELVDLSRVYVVADVPQGELAGIQVGTEGTFSRRDHPNEKVQAKVDLIYPTIDVEARTTRVRMIVKNPKLELRPGEFGVVEFASSPRRGLVVPRDAVIDTGASIYVFVDEGNGKFAPRGVTLGTALDGDVEIVAGLREGEQVVSGATFLVDSESALQASVSGASSTTPSGATSGAPAVPGGPPSVCDQKFDRAKYPDKYTECQKCERIHRGMGTMAEDCENAIPKPWK
jgi:Cu(I)/Ag(I) efflux system membrane fusion protein